MSAPPTPTSNTVTTVATPVAYGSPKELESEVANLLAIYTEKEGEANWTKRERVLLRFRGLLLSGAAQEQPFLLAMKKLVTPITESMLSLRTQLAMQAIFLAGDLAESMKNEFLPYIEPFSQVFLKLFSQTKKILANTASEVMAKMVESLEAQKLIPVFAATIADKNKDVRIKGSEMIKKMLDHWSADAFAKNEATIEKAFQQGLADATPQVRETMRGAFWQYVALCPARGSMLRKSLDGATKKHLDKARPKGVTLVDDDEGTSTPSETPVTASPLNSPLWRPKAATPVEGMAGGPRSPAGGDMRSKLREFAIRSEDHLPEDSKEKSQEQAGSKLMKFEVNLDDVEPMEDDTPSTKEDPLPSISTATTGAVSANHEESSEPSPEQVAQDLSPSVTLSTWQKAEAEEEPWVEVDYEKELNTNNRQPSQSSVVTPKKGPTPTVYENKENMKTPNHVPTTPQRELFLTPAILKLREYPRTPSTASPNYDWEEALPVMLSQLEAGNARNDVFRKLARLSRNHIHSVWKTHFEAIYRASSQFLLTHPQAESILKEQCLDLLKEMLNYQRDHFVGKEEEVLRLLLRTERDSSPSVKYAALNALNSMATHLPLCELYDVWTRSMMQEPREEGEQKVLFSIFPKVLSRFSSSKNTHLADTMPQLSQFLIQELQNSNNSIRRSVVESIIEIRLATNDQLFATHFGNLALQQRKLVEMYMKKHPSVAAKSVNGDHDHDHAEE